MRSPAKALAVAALVLAGLGSAAGAVGGQNPYVSLPLHGATSSFEACLGYLPVDCGTVLPTVSVPPGATTVFLLVHNFSCIAGLQTAFETDPGWAFTFGLWDCQPGQLSAVSPAAPLGATAGSITTAFNFLYGPQLAVVGRMFFTASGGCLRQVQSSYPFATHVLDCQQGIDLIETGEDQRLGRICIGQGGVDACQGGPPLDNATWGSIKAQF